MVSAGDRAGIPGGRRGFTLIELLVVLGILMLLMGITVVAIVSRPRIDAMIGAEQALSGAIRQARHTARSTGQPVVLRLKAKERQIAGLMREPLWHGLEGWTTPASALAVWPGRTGTGLNLPDAFCPGGDGSLPIDPLSPNILLPGIDGQPLTKGQRLWRGRGASPNHPRSPLMLSVAVLPPIAVDLTTPGAIEVLPLVLVGNDADPVRGSYENSYFGLALLNTSAATSTAIATDVSASHQKGVAASWEILGWFGTESGGRVEVSSIQNPPAGSGSHILSSTPLLSGATDNIIGISESGPLTGGRWTELGLLFDGTRLVIYRDGRRVGEKPAAAVTISDDDAERVFVGMANINGTARFAQGAVLDDVRLERLGDALAGNLPNGVQPSADYTITCHPDGRVEGAAAGATTISLISTSGPSATLTVQTTGTISLSQVTP